MMLEANWSLELIITRPEHKTIYAKPQSTIQFTKYCSVDGKAQFDQLEVVFSFVDSVLDISSFEKLYVNIKIEDINIISTRIMEESFYFVEGTAEDESHSITTTIEAHMIIHRNLYTKKIRCIIFRCNFSDMNNIFMENFTHIPQIT